MIRVLVVDDSTVLREFLVQILDSDKDMKVVATARDGEEAIEVTGRHRPDVITMDIHMPKLDGIEATRRIMESHPTPIVIVSGSTDPKEVATTFSAMEAGAIAVLCRPAGVGHPDHESSARELVQTVRLMSEVRVVRRWPRGRRTTSATSPPERLSERSPVTVQVVAIGASTGGPPVIQTILSGLPRDFPAPVLVVQHMATGFTEGFVEWLGQTVGVPVHLATHGETVLPGHVYVAPDELQMRVEQGGRVGLSRAEPENGLRPSVSFLFRSVAAVYGSGAVAGLLTGMGRDGAEELKVLRDLGALTFAQDKESSIVHGMPGAAILLDAATLVLPPEKIASTLVGITNRRREGG